ncbi:MAG TPA: serine hydrolase domain-containing protein [Rugosimonospora sp.]|nr:serine hydrolase domain-containing protein [Rugosimonospora sp.]
MDIAVLAEALDRLVPEILELTRAPGVSIAVGMGEEVAWAKGYGHADVAHGRPMTPQTVGPTGSDCKPYTAVAALQLVERGLIGLHDPVDDHLDGLRLDNPHGGPPVTLWHLLTHRSGLGTNFGYTTRVPPAPLGEHLRRVFRDARGDAYQGMLPFWATPVGANYQYSNTGIAVVGYLVERLNPEGLSFPEYLRRHVFAPLGMASTCFPPAQHPDHVPAGLLSRRSVGYATLAGLRFVLPQFYPGDYPAGSALTTPSDHARFLLAVANGGQLGGARILRRETAGQMVTPQAAFGPDPNAAVGLVWTVFHHGSPHGYFGHGGEYMWGWSNFARAWPHHRVALVVACNQWDLGDMGTSERPSHFAGRLVAGAVTAWVNGVDPRPRRDPAAGRGYLAGALVSVRLGGALGIDTPPSDVDIERIASTALVDPGTPWDPDAFRAGLRDAGATGGSLPGMIRLARREIPDHERELLQRQLGLPWMGRNIPPELAEFSPGDAPG